MRRLGVHVLLGLAVVAGVATAAGNTVAAASESACTPGLRKVGGAQIQVYCGPAKATVKFNGKSVSFVNGTCVRATNAWAINVGSATIPPAKPKYSYLGITTGKLQGDRTYKKAAVGFQWRGKSYSVVSNAVTIQGKGTRGTFTGRLNETGGPKVTGSFSC